MTSHTTERFRKLIKQLPDDVRRQAREAYRLFSVDSYHPSLHFKRVHPTEPIVSVRIGRSYRALGRQRGSEIDWFWIGSHADYDRVVAQG